MTDESPRETTDESPPEVRDESRVSRKKFLGGVAGLSVGGLALAGVLAACGGDDEETAEEAAPPPPEAVEPAPPTAPAGAGEPIVIGSAYPLTTSDGAETKGRSDLAIAVIIGYHNVTGPEDILAAYGAPFLNASTSTDQVALLKSDPPKYANIFQCDPTEAAYGIGFPPFLEGLIAQGLFNPPAKTIHIYEGDIPYSSNISKGAQ